MSAIDCVKQSYLTSATNIPRITVYNDQPEELFFVDPRSKREVLLEVGGDRPGVLAYRRGMMFAWVGECGSTTQIIDLSTGIPHAYPAEPRHPAREIELAPCEYYEGEDGGYASAITFRDGAWWLLWPTGILADHLGSRAIKILPPPRAAAFDESGRRLAVIVESEIVLLDVDSVRTLCRFPIPSRRKLGKRSLRALPQIKSKPTKKTAAKKKKPRSR
jgi:hypothetical protein